MTATLPASKPRATSALVTSLARKVAQKAGVTLPALYLVGVRGYYCDSMGKPGVNDRGIYDDAIFVVGPDGLFVPFNANCDPGAFKSGIANLLPGVHMFRPGNHGISKPGGGYPAFRPATKGEALPVQRDGESTVPSKRPGIAINIHKGGYSTVSSAGCQTIPPAQWDAFHKLVSLQLKKTGQKTFPYVLMVGPIN